MEGGICVNIISLGIAFSLGMLLGFFTKESTQPDTTYNLEWKVKRNYLEEGVSGEL
jgi:hypothetical protein